MSTNLDDLDLEYSQSFNETNLNSNENNLNNFGRKAFAYSSQASLFMEDNKNEQKLSIPRPIDV